MVLIVHEVIVLVLLVDFVVGLVVEVAEDEAEED